MSALEWHHGEFVGAFAAVPALRCIRLARAPVPARQLLLLVGALSAVTALERHHGVLVDALAAVATLFGRAAAVLEARTRMYVKEGYGRRERLPSLVVKVAARQRVHVPCACGGGVGKKYIACPKTSAVFKHKRARVANSLQSPALQHAA